MDVGERAIVIRATVQQMFSDSEIDTINFFSYTHTHSLCNPALMLQSPGGVGGSLVIQIVTCQLSDAVNGGVDLGCDSCTGALDWLAGVQLNMDSDLLPPVKDLIAISSQETLSAISRGLELRDG